LLPPGKLVKKVTRQRLSLVGFLVKRFWVKTVIIHLFFDAAQQEFSFFFAFQKN
jgi:hypothetical protein